MFLAAFGHDLADSARSIRRVAQLTVLIALPLLLAHYATEAARMADDWSGLVDPTLQRLVLASSGSAMLIVRLSGLGIVAIALRRESSSGRTASVIGAVLVAASFAFAGHTSAHRLRALLAPLLITHVLIVAFWFGSLLPLYIASTRETAQRAGRVIAAFSAIATWLVPGIAVAGLLMTLMLVRQLGVFLEPYGWLLIGKAVGFVMLMVLAALNKWRLGPAIATNDGRAVRTFRRSLGAEYALIAAVLAATVVMTTFFSPDPSK